MSTTKFKWNVVDEFKVPVDFTGATDLSIYIVQIISWNKVKYYKQTEILITGNILEFSYSSNDLSGEFSFNLNYIKDGKRHEINTKLGENIFAIPAEHTHKVVTLLKNGFMSNLDKGKLDKLPIMTNNNSLLMGDGARDVVVLTNENNIYFDKGLPNGTYTGKNAIAIGYNEINRVEINPETNEVENEYLENSWSWALGDLSFSYGHGTMSSGLCSHSQGIFTSALGISSHAEGWGTIANSAYQHVSGKWNLADPLNGGDNIGKYAFIVGNGLSETSRSNALTVDWSGTLGIKNNILIGGGAKDTHTFSGHPIIPNGTYTGTTSFAVSTDTYNTQPSYALALGVGSLAYGREVIAFGDFSHAEGGETIATGERSHAEGSSTLASELGAHAEGGITIASGIYSHAEGIRTTALGMGSHSEGYNTRSEGEGSHAEGDNTLTLGFYSHAEGYFTTANRAYQHVLGMYNILDTEGDEVDMIGKYALIVGNGKDENNRTNALTVAWNGETEATILKASNNLLVGSGAIIEITYSEDIINVVTGDILIPSNTYRGVNSIAVGPNEYAADISTSVSIGESTLSIGNNTIAYGDFSQAYGYNSMSIGKYSLASGEGALAAGLASFAQGLDTQALGAYSFAQGYITTASGYASHAQGHSSVASGNYSHAEGQGTTASGFACHTDGLGTIANSAYQLVIGSFNFADPQAGGVDKGRYAFMVGNGTNNDDRQNAATIDWLGNMNIAGTLTQSSDERLKEFSNNIIVDFDKLSKLRKAHFTWKTENKENQIGMSAQEVKEIYPELVDSSNPEHLALDYSKLSVIALAAIDELYKMNLELKKEIKELKLLL